MVVAVTLLAVLRLFCEPTETGRENMRALEMSAVRRRHRHGCQTTFQHLCQCPGPNPTQVWVEDPAEKECMHAGGARRNGES